MKQIFIGILINVIIIGVFLYFIPKSAFDHGRMGLFEYWIYGDPCSIDSIDKKIMNHVRRHPEKWIDEDNPNKKITSIEDISGPKLARNEYALLKKFKCSISAEFEHRIFTKLHAKLEAHPQTQDCPLDFKEEEVLKNFNYIYRDAYYAQKYEEKLIDTIKSSISYQSNLIIQTKFEDHKFRKKLTLAILQSNEREMHKCKLPSLPLWPLSKELLEIPISSAEKKK